MASAVDIRATLERELGRQRVVEDLRANGLDVRTLGELHGQPQHYSVAIPVLLAHLRLDYPETTLAEIGDALPLRPATVWWEDLKALYLSTKSEAVRHRLAAAMGQRAAGKHYADLVAFVSDPLLGESRTYFLKPLYRIGNRMRPGAGRGVIQDLVQDETLGSAALAILGSKGRRC